MYPLHMDSFQKHHNCKNIGYFRNYYIQYTANISASQLRCYISDSSLAVLRAADGSKLGCLLPSAALSTAKLLPSAGLSTVKLLSET